MLFVAAALKYPASDVAIGTACPSTAFCAEPIAIPLLSNPLWFAKSRPLWAARCMSGEFASINPAMRPSTGIVAGSIAIRSVWVSPVKALLAFTAAALVVSGVYAGVVMRFSHTPVLALKSTLFNPATLPAPKSLDHPVFALAFAVLYDIAA